MSVNKFVLYEQSRKQGMQMLNDKQPVAKVAVALGVSRQTVYNWIKRKQAIKALEEGVAPVDVAEKYCISKRTVNRWASEKKYDGAIETGGRPRKLSEAQRTRLHEMIGQSAKDFGFDSEVWTGERIAVLIEQEFDVHFNPKSVPQMLRNWGWDWRQRGRGRLPKKA